MVIKIIKNEEIKYNDNVHPVGKSGAISGISQMVLDSQVNTTLISLSTLNDVSPMVMDGCFITQCSISRVSQSPSDLHNLYLYPSYPVSHDAFPMDPAAVASYPFSLGQFSATVTIYN